MQFSFDIPVTMHFQKFCRPALPYRSEARRQTKRKRYSAVGETEVDQEELLQSAEKRSREDVDDEVGGWRDVDDELDSLRDDLDKSF